jgi:hypothetical protein
MIRADPQIEWRLEKTGLHLWTSFLLCKLSAIATLIHLQAHLDLFPCDHLPADLVDPALADDLSLEAAALAFLRACSLLGFKLGALTTGNSGFQFPSLGRRVSPDNARSLVRPFIPMYWYSHDSPPSVRS